MQRRKYIICEGIKNWQELSWYCKERGMDYLNFEPMSIPREMANTVEDTKELLARLNAAAGIPFMVCLDVGYAPNPNDRERHPESTFHEWQRLSRRARAGNAVTKRIGYIQLILFAVAGEPFTVGSQEHFPNEVRINHGLFYFSDKVLVNWR
ncbi:hypothetical protein Back11_15480 [Paenibacillus baekrokdamisoli]|uniref:Uncharacterized protein n=1 Tax=Paenibacillus baekrokdamisoli TaxID=1712516 RepID=A0A3G9J5W9_9BACL|nr:hypothetical protein [Paenibacillus baekrokdamisoli]MBB3073250.1 hypothetical protein [Paenibacillus baekrokdamisoli]BBH20203.1 hypothetical protein Back11_15480 [Paenibacillus baekrokdamisoli]